MYREKGVTTILQLLVHLKVCLNYANGDSNLSTTYHKNTPEKRYKVSVELPKQLYVIPLESTGT